MFIVSKWLSCHFNSLFKSPFFLKGFMGGNVGITFPVSEALYNFLMAFYWKIDWLIIISTQLEKACAQQWRPSTVKIQTNKLKKNFFKMVGSVLYAVLSCSVVSDSLQPHGLQPARLVCPLGFSRQEYWSGLPWPRSPALWAASLQR